MCWLAAAARASRNEERLLDLGGQLGVTIRAQLGDEGLGEARVQLAQLLLEHVAVGDLPAAEAAHALQRTVQLDHVLAPGAVMQPVHVLGDQPRQRAARFPLRQRLVSGVRLEAGEPRPAEQTARPVPRADLRTANELLMLDRPADAIELLDQLPPEDASSSRAKTVRARALITLGRWNEANPILTELVKQTPVSAEAHYLMGLWFQHDQDWAHAAEQFRLAFERSAAPPTSRGAGE